MVSGCAVPLDPAPTTPSVLLEAANTNQAATLFAAGKFPEAEQRYRLALKGQPGDVALRLGLAATLSKQVEADSVARPDQASEADRIYRDLLAERPNALGVILGSAAGYASLGRYEQALSLFERAFELAAEPTVASVALRNYATVAQRACLFGEAVSTSRKAYDTQPSGLEANRHLALLNQLGLTVEAQRFAAKVLAVFGSDEEVLLRSAAAFAAAGDCEQAQRIVLRIREQGRFSDKTRRDALLISDWCNGVNRLAELRPDELATWPISMRPIR